MTKPSKPKTGLRDRETAVLLREAEKIVEGLGAALAPFCEVVLHDLTTPDHAIVKILNNMSGRSIGESATELGLARIANPDFPDLLTNYTNTLPDGRPIKSSSIGIKNSDGRFIAAICLNFDVSYFGDIIVYLKQFIDSKPLSLGISESLTAKAPRQSIDDLIREFAARRNVQPKSLTPAQRHELMSHLREQGLLELRGAASKVAAMIGVSRTSLYHYLNSDN